MCRGPWEGLTGDAQVQATGDAQSGGVQTGVMPSLLSLAWEERPGSLGAVTGVTVEESPRGYC